MSHVCSIGQPCMHIGKYTIPMDPSCLKVLSLVAFWHVLFLSMAVLKGSLWALASTSPWRHFVGGNTRVQTNPSSRNAAYLGKAKPKFHAFLGWNDWGGDLGKSKLEC